MTKGTCLSTSCTTGWLDWVHGELWLVEDRGLLRVPLGLAQTLKNGVWHTEGSSLHSVKSMTVREAAATASNHPKGLWLPKERILAAHIRNGLITSRLLLELADGSRVKLMWRRPDRAAQVLKPVLEKWLTTQGQSSD